MSKILEKPFDAAKKIIRSVFKGSPNLLTTSDLNRQIEALKDQMDTMCDYIGCIGAPNIVIDYSFNGSTLTVTVEDSDMWVKGAWFTLPNPLTLSINFTASTGPAYLVLTADKELVTYEDDFSHEISGAVFEDGETLPAADNYVYKNATLALVHTVLDANIVAVISKFTLKYGKVEEHGYVVDRDYSLHECVGNWFSYRPNDARVSRITGLCSEQSTIRSVLNNVLYDLNNGIATNEQFNVEDDTQIIATAKVNRVSKVIFVTIDMSAHAFLEYLCHSRFVDIPNLAQRYGIRDSISAVNVSWTANNKNFSSKDCPDVYGTVNSQGLFQLHTSYGLSGTEIENMNVPYDANVKLSFWAISSDD